MQEVKEILREQLGLLAEASKRTPISTDELCRLSGAMVEITGSLMYQDPFGACLPDKYELARLDKDEKDIAALIMVSEHRLSNEDLARWEAELSERTGKHCVIIEPPFTTVFRV